MHHLQPKKTHQHPDEAYNQFIELPNMDDSIVSGEGDIWVYIWGTVQILLLFKGLQSYESTQTSISGIHMRRQDVRRL